MIFLYFSSNKLGKSNYLWYIVVLIVTKEIKMKVSELKKRMTLKIDNSHPTTNHLSPTGVVVSCKSKYPIFTNRGQEVGVRATNKWGHDSIFSINIDLLSLV